MQQLAGRNRQNQCNRYSAKRAPHAPHLYNKTRSKLCATGDATPPTKANPLPTTIPVVGGANAERRYAAEEEDEVQKYYISPPPRLFRPTKMFERHTQLCQFVFWWTLAARTLQGKLHDARCSIFCREHFQQKVGRPLAANGGIPIVNRTEHILCYTGETRVLVRSCTMYMDSVHGFT